jgi:predicted transglutaminase-like cysteine proteinase
MSWRLTLVRYAFIVPTVLLLAPAVAQQGEDRTFRVAASIYRGLPLSAEPFGRNVVPAPEGSYSAKWRLVRDQITRDASLVNSCRNEPNQCPSAAASKFAAVITEALAYGGRARLAAINRLINHAIRRASDFVAFGEDDHWAAPIEAFSVGRGDCEEFAIAKYVALSEVGWPASDLRLVIGLDTSIHREHMVVGARHEGRWLVLDNRSNILAEDRNLGRFAPLFVLDQRGVLRFDAASHAEALGVSSER